MELKDKYAVWKNATEIDAPKEILSGTDNDIHSLYKKYDRFINIIEEKGTILDFACGVGRNTIELSKRFKLIVAYDFENMINMLKSTKVYKKRNNIKTYIHWEDVSKQSFDAIFCSICLQHVYTDDLLNYLKDFTKMSHNLYVFTRAYNDHNGDNIFMLLTKYWNVDNTYDKGTEEIVAMRGEDHYLIKLVPKDKYNE